MKTTTRFHKLTVWFLITIMLITASQLSVLATDPGDLNFEAVPGDRVITVTWDELEAENVSYIVFSSDADGENYTEYHDEYQYEDGKYTYVIEGLENNKTYTVGVEAVSESFEYGSMSAESDETPYSADATVPDAPIITEIIKTDGTITVSWEAPENDGGAKIIGYEIECWPEGSEDGNGGMTISVDADAFSYTIDDLPDANISYDIKICAVNTVGYSEYGVLQTIPEAPNSNDDFDDKYAFAFRCIDSGYGSMSPASYIEGYSAAGQVYKENGEYFCDITWNVKSTWENDQADRWDNTYGCGVHTPIEELPESLVFTAKWDAGKEKWVYDEEDYIVYLVTCMTASTTYVAEVNGTSYASLPDAITAAQNDDTVVILADVELNNQLTIEKNLILDLNGKSVTITNEKQNHQYALYVLGNLIINDSSDGGTGKLTGKSQYGIFVLGNLTVNSGEVIGTVPDGSTSSKYGIVIQNGNLTVNGGKVTGTTFGNISHGIVVLFGSMTVNGGKITGTTSGDESCGLFITNNLTINSGEVIGKGDFAGIYVSEDSNMNVNGGIAEGEGILNGVIAHGNLIVTEGTVTGTATGNDESWGLSVNGALAADVIEGSLDSTYVKLGAGKCSIAIAPAEGGTVETDTENPDAGDEVTITVTPDECIEFVEVVVKDKNGEPVEIIDNGDGTYTYEQPEGTVIIEAKFIAKSYLATWTDGNGASYEKNFKYGEVIKIPQNEFFEETFRKGGYTLTGWDGYTEGMTMPIDGVTFTAVYVPNTYTVSFDANGGAEINPITVTYGEKYGRLPSTSVTGLSGGDKNWYLVDKYGNVTETNIKSATALSEARDHTLFAVRKVLAPTLGIKLAAPGCISDKYQYYNPENSTRILTVTVNNKNDDVLYYTYQWYKDGEVIEGETADVLTLAGNVSDSGKYKVVVTATLKDGTNIVVTHNSASSEKEQVVKIMHAANTLYYEANGGEGGPSSQFTGGTTITITSNEPTRTGYIFAGWNTEADGSGTAYMAGDVFTFENDNGNGGCAVTLYAQYHFIPVTKTAPTATRIKQGKLLSASSLKGGKMLNAEGTAIKGTFTWKEPDTEMNITGDNEAIAVFTPNDTVNYTTIEVTVTVNVYTSSATSITVTSVYYDVLFDTDGGDKIAYQSIRRNNTVKEPDAPKKDGYTFEGWFADKDLTTVYDFTAKVTKSLTLYAKWTAIEKDTENNKPADLEKWENPFTDINENDWFYADVEYAVENDLFNGTSATAFSPNGIITRAMLVTVLYRAEGELAVNKSIPFADVDMGAYYANAVIWAKQNGIVNGVSETEFAPDSNITREQIATIMHRYAQYKGYDVSVGENTNILSYDDFGSISEYAIASMQYAAGNGLMKGTTASTLNPKENATRAEIAAILHRFIENNK